MSSTDLASNDRPTTAGLSRNSSTRIAPLRKKSTATDKLEEINKQIAEVRKQRQDITQSDGRVIGSRIDYSKPLKKSFHHPKLEYVYGEIVYSPYMTKPQDKYSEETFQMNGKLREMKKKGLSFSDVPREEKPYNEKKVKNLFISEVVNFNPCFSPPEQELKPVNIRASTGSLSGLLSAFTNGTRGSAMSTTAGDGEYKSLVLQSAEARGGPAKFKKQFRQLSVARRTPSASAMEHDSVLSGANSRRNSEDDAKQLESFISQFQSAAASTDAHPKVAPKSASRGGSVQSSRQSRSGGTKSKPGSVSAVRKSVKISAETVNELKAVTDGNSGQTKKAETSAAEESAAVQESLYGEDDFEDGLATITEAITECASQSVDESAAKSSSANAASGALIDSDVPVPVDEEPGEALYTDEAFDVEEQHEQQLTATEREAIGGITESVNDRAYTPPIEEVQEAERAYTPPIEEVQEAERANIPPVEEVHEAERAYTPPVEEVQEVERAYTPPVEEVQEAERVYTPPVEEVQEVERAYTPPVEEVQEVERAYTPPIEEVQEVERVYTPPVEEVERAYTPPVEEVQGAERMHTAIVEVQSVVGVHEVLPKEEVVGAAVYVPTELSVFAPDPSDERPVDAAAASLSLEALPLDDVAVNASAAAVDSAADSSCVEEPPRSLEDSLDLISMSPAQRTNHNSEQEQQPQAVLNNFVDSPTTAQPNSADTTVATEA